MLRQHVIFGSLAAALIVASAGPAGAAGGTASGGASTHADAGMDAAARKVDQQASTPSGQGRKT